MSMPNKKLIPFTTEEANAIKAMLYNVNANHKCCNPSHKSWIDGYMKNDTDRIGREGIYKESEQSEESEC